MIAAVSCSTPNDEVYVEETRAGVFQVTETDPSDGFSRKDFIIFIQEEGVIIKPKATAVAEYAFSYAEGYELDSDSPVLIFGRKLTVNPFDFSRITFDGNDRIYLDYKYGMLVAERIE